MNHTEELLSKVIEMQLEDKRVLQKQLAEANAEIERLKGELFSRKNMPLLKITKCKRCSGSGKVFTNESYGCADVTCCAVCSGSGEIIQPVGSDENQTLRDRIAELEDDKKETLKLAHDFKEALKIATNGMCKQKLLNDWYEGENITWGGKILQTAGIQWSDLRNQALASKQAEGGGGEG